MILQTGRLLLQVLDKKTFNKYKKELIELNEDVGFHYPTGVATEEETIQRMKEFINFYEIHQIPSFVILDKFGKEFIGRCGFSILSQGDIEVRYLLHKKFWGQGLASEALKTLLTWAQDNLSSSYVIGYAPIEHKSSQKVMEKAGMQHYKTEKDELYGTICEFYRYPLKKCIDVKRFILTGTPGSGKTSVILELEKLGHVVIHEGATDIIVGEQAKGIERPWEQPNFVDKIAHMQEERQMNAKGDLQFYDRSPFCTYALDQYLSYWNNIEFTPVNILLNEIDRCLKGRIYQSKVFFFENLGFIEYTEARKISYQDALIFEQIHLDVYNQFDFEVITVPKGLTIAQRCEFILKSAT